MHVCKIIIMTNIMILNNDINDNDIKEIMFTYTSLKRLSKLKECDFFFLIER